MTPREIDALVAGNADALNPYFILVFVVIALAVLVFAYFYTERFQ